MGDWGGTDLISVTAPRPNVVVSPTIPCLYAGFVLEQLGAAAFLLERDGQGVRTLGEAGWGAAATAFLLPSRRVRSLDEVPDPGAAILTDADARSAKETAAPVVVTILDAEGVDSSPFLRYHVSGLSRVTPRGAKGAQLLPLGPQTHILEVMSGLYAATAVQALLFARRGGRATVDTRRVGAALLRREFAQIQKEPRDAKRDLGWGISPTGIFETQDGPVYLSVVSEAEWARFAELLRENGLRPDAVYTSRDVRLQERTAVRRLASSLLAQWTRSQAFHTLQACRVAVAPVYSAADLVVDRHFEERDLVAERNGVRGIRLPVRVRRAEREGRSGRPRTHRADAKVDLPPLTGVRILELGHVWAAPYLTQVLADLGAEVIRVESTRHVDVHRLDLPFFAGRDGDMNASMMWHAQNRGKASIALNLKHPAGPTVLRQLARVSDAVVENFAPGTLDRLGIGFDALVAENPAIVLASLTGFGQRGPYRDYVAYGPVLDAAACICDALGRGTGGPLESSGWAADVGGALVGVATLLAAVRAARRSGCGAHLDVAEVDAAALTQLPDLVSALNRDEVRSPGERAAERLRVVAECGDGELVAVETPVGVEFATVFKAVVTDRSSTWQSRCATEMSSDVVLAAARNAGGRAVRIPRLEELLLDDALMLITSGHRADGYRNYRPVIATSHGIEWVSRRPAPDLGEDTARVLAEVLGPQRFEELAREEGLLE